MENKRVLTGEVGLEVARATEAVRVKFALAEPDKITAEEYIAAAEYILQEEPDSQMIALRKREEGCLITWRLHVTRTGTILPKNQTLLTAQGIPIGELSVEKATAIVDSIISKSANKEKVIYLKAESGQLEYTYTITAYKKIEMDYDLFMMLIEKR